MTPFFCKSRAKSDQKTDPNLSKYTKQRELDRFDGKISVAQAFPYGVQHVLAMFVANLAPLLSWQQLQASMKQLRQSLFRTL